MPKKTENSPAGRLLAWFKRRSIWDYLTFVLLAAVLFTQAPRWWAQWHRQGQTVSNLTISEMNGAAASIPPQDTSSILLFWATWCGPCDVELDRLKKAVDEGDLDPKRILAISVGEERDVVMRAAQERNYPFRVLVDREGEAARFFNVEATPTVVFVDRERQATWITSGLSPTLIWRARYHLSRN